MNVFARLHHLLFDFSASEREARRITGLLEVALAESETDAGFEACFRRVVRATNGLDEEMAWVWLQRCLIEYRRVDEYGPIPRTLARRYLDDIPRRYGLKKKP